MIKLTKLNNAEILINHTQIEFVELIPESKIIMMNGHYHIVKESADEIIKKTLQYENVKIGQIFEAASKQMKED